MSKLVAPKEFGGAKQDDGSVRREASRVRECFSPQVAPEGLDVLSRDVGGWQRAR